MMARSAILLLVVLLAGCYQSYPRIALDAEADACVPRVIEAERVTPGVYILLDRSRSMCYPICGDPENPPEWDYWTPAVTGIDGIVGALEEDVAFGLGLFPDPMHDAEEPNCFVSAEAAERVRLGASRPRAVRGLQDGVDPARHRRRP
jgi:hypothetical protein